MLLEGLIAELVMDPVTGLLRDLPAFWCTGDLNPLPCALLTLLTGRGGVKV